jgi:hypothetical protein
MDQCPSEMHPVGPGLQQQPDELPKVFAHDFPTLEQFAADLAKLSARSLKMLFVYTANEDGSYNDRNQFHDRFGYRDEIEVEFYAHADHVFSSEAQRERLLSGLVRWLDMKFPRQPFVQRTQDVADAAARRVSTPALYFVGPVAAFSVSRLLGLFVETNVLSA